VKRCRCHERQKFVSRLSFLADPEQCQASSLLYLPSVPPNVGGGMMLNANDKSTNTD
jgi:hypothetical protein